jgi:hypothetical protein
VRLWASICSICFDEFAKHLGEVTDASFRISVKSIGPDGDSKTNRDWADSDWAFGLSGLGPSNLVQFPNLERTFTGVTGLLQFQDEPRSQAVIHSRIPLEVHDTYDGPFLAHLQDFLDGADQRNCEALGTLSVASRELSASNHSFLPVLVLRLQSLCLRTGDPRFGEWFDVTRYDHLGSDPDVIGAPVCVAEVELLA